MGTIISKKSAPNPPPTQTTSTNSNNPQVNPDLTSYEAACRLDPDLLTFDSSLRDRTSHVINSLAVGRNGAGGGVEVHEFSLESLRVVIESLLDMNREVVKVTLQCKEDIWNTKELFGLVEVYFDNSLKTLDFITALEKCLKRATDSRLIVQAALKQFGEEQRLVGGEGVSNINCFSSTLAELKNFKTAGDPFTDDFFQLLNSVHANQMSLLQKLQLKKIKLDKKLKKSKSWRKVSNVLFVATFTAVLICSVVFAAVSAPPVLTALAAAAAVPLGSMGRWLNSVWRRYEKELEGQKLVVGSIYTGTRVAITELESIGVLVDKLEIAMEAMLNSADLAIREEEESALTIAMDEIKKKLNGFMETIEVLSEHAGNCSKDIRLGRTVVLHKIIRRPTRAS